MMNTTDQLYTESKAKLQQFVSGRISDPLAAEDLVHEIFLEAFSYMDSGDPVRHPEGLLFKIARRRIIDYYRRRKTQSDLPVDESTLQDTEPEYLEKLNRQELLEPATRYLLDQLPERYRRVLRLTELEGWSHQDVADELGISLSAVKSRVIRGRKKLRQHVHQVCHVEYDRSGRFSDCTPKCDCDDCMTLEIDS